MPARQRIYRRTVRGGGAAKRRRDRGRRFPCLWAACIGLFAALVPAAAEAAADLLIRLEGPQSALPGDEVSVKVTVHNGGSHAAPGTDSGDGYMVDLVLTRGAVPVGFAVYADTYSDGVLLRGGRISNTRTLAAGDTAIYSEAGRLPADTPHDVYRLCATVDPGGKVSEDSEDNNVACIPLRVGLGTEALRNLMPFGTRILEPRELGLDRLRILPGAIDPPQPTGGGGVQRTVLADGTIELRFPDGSIRRLRPDGTVESISPDGRVTVPMMMQVEGADLPALAGPLSAWGDTLADSLLSILGNILTEAEYAAYLGTEAGKDYYEVIDWRVRAIAFLTSAEAGG